MILNLSLLVAVLLSSVASGGLAESESVQPDGCEADGLPCNGRDSPLEESQWLQQSESVQPGGCEADDLSCNGRELGSEDSSWLQGKLLWVMQDTVMPGKFVD